MAKKRKGWSLSLSSGAPALGGLNTCHQAPPPKGASPPKNTAGAHTFHAWRDIEDLNPSSSSACLRSPAAPPPTPWSVSVSGTGVQELSLSLQPSPYSGVCLSQELALPYSRFPQLDPSLCSSACVSEALPSCSSSFRLAWMTIIVPLRSSSVDCRDYPGHIPHAVDKHLPQLSAKFWGKELL